MTLWEIYANNVFPFLNQIIQQMRLISTKLDNCYHRKLCDISVHKCTYNNILLGSDLKMNLWLCKTVPLLNLMILVPMENQKWPPPRNSIKHQTLSYEYFIFIQKINKVIYLNYILLFSINFLKVYFQLQYKKWLLIRECKKITV